MKRIIAMFLLSMTLVGCGERALIEEEVEFVGNIVVESKRDEQVAVFMKPNGEILNLFWEDESSSLEQGKIYKVQYHENDNYTDYMTILNYQKLNDKN